MRHDFYGTIHKALRRALAELLIDAGRAGGCAQWAELEARLGKLAHVLSAHAEHEEKFIHPLLRRHAPPIDAALVAAHRDLDAGLGSAQGALREAAGPGAPPSRERGARAHAALASFVTAYLGHMDAEESDAMPALWKAMNDVELGAVHGALMAAVRPEDMPIFLSLMLPAITHDERVELLAGVRAALPPPAFEGVMSLAQGVLDGKDFASARAALDEARAS